MEGLIEKNEVIAEKKESENGGKMQTFGDLVEEKGHESCSSSDFMSSETTAHEEQSQSSTEESSSPSMGWPVKEISTPNCNSPKKFEDSEEKHLENKKFQKQVSAMPGIYVHSFCIF